MPRKKKEPTALETTVANLQGQLSAVLQLGGNKTAAKTVVGIRNISCDTVGMYNKVHGEVGEVTLHAERFGQYDPNNVAIVSEQFWREIRKGKLVALGILMRDDSVCGGNDNIAPPDRPEDLPPGHEKNMVIDPFHWIESKTEDELSVAIQAIDSETTLRRLAAAVNHKIWQIGEEKYKDHVDRAKLAIRDTPARYHWVDKRVEDRLDELNPWSKERGEERETKVNFRG